MSPSLYYLVTAWTVFLLVGLAFFAIGLLIGRLLWRGHRARAEAIASENARLLEQAEDLDRQCDADELALASLAGS